MGRDGTYLKLVAEDCVAADEAQVEGVLVLHVLPDFYVLAVVGVEIVQVVPREQLGELLLACLSGSDLHKKKNTKQSKEPSSKNRIYR